MKRLVVVEAFMWQVRDKLWQFLHLAFSQLMLEAVEINTSYSSGAQADCRTPPQKQSAWTKKESNCCANNMVITGANWQIKMTCYHVDADLEDRKQWHYKKATFTQTQGLKKKQWRFSAFGHYIFVYQWRVFANDPSWKLWLLWRFTKFLFPFVPGGRDWYKNS